LPPLEAPALEPPLPPDPPIPPVEPEDEVSGKPSMLHAEASRTNARVDVERFREQVVIEYSPGEPRHRKR
jgi:hypothetical protein